MSSTSRSARLPDAPHEPEPARAGSAADLYFSPRPEAHRMRWNELSAPVKSAVEALLLRLRKAGGDPDDGAERPDPNGERERTATTVLVSGKRGTGKTTVLLSARYATEAPREFFSGSAPESQGGLFDRANHLHSRLVWLDPLDLEPLPARANLLATLLVRVRTALRGPERGTASLLEETDDSAYDKVDRLLRDAAFMWEDVSEGDRRTSAETQIKAAEIYARFPHEFCDAIGVVAREVGRLHHRDSSKTVLVLPIDNVDRSIDHLKSILKLTRVVTSPHMWLVLAAGRPDFQVFLQHAFISELSGGRALSSLGPERGQELISIARAQAAAAQRKFLPPLHRVEIETAGVEDALIFKPGPPASRDDDPTLGELFAQIRLWNYRGHNSPGPMVGSLYDLLFLGSDRLHDAVLSAHESERKRVQAASGEPTALEDEPDPRATPAAQRALRLPVRNLLDLWQAAKRAAPDGGEGAVDVVEAMLRSAVDESDLPEWAVGLLQHRILIHDENRRPTLDLGGALVKRLRKVSLRVAFSLGTRPRDDHFGATLVLNELHRFLLLLQNPDPGTGGERSVALPPDVAALWILLHDLLITAPKPRIVNDETPGHRRNPLIAGTCHDMVLGGSREPAPSERFVQYWPIPAWTTFYDVYILVRHWAAFMYHFHRLLRGPRADVPPGADRDEHGLRQRLVRAAWIDLVCSVAGPQRGGWDPTERCSLWEEHDPTRKGECPALTTGAVEQYEEAVLTRAGELYLACRDIEIRNERSNAARRWLEDDLPLLFLPEHTTAPCPSLLQRLPPRPATGGSPPSGLDELIRQWRPERLTHARARALVDAFASHLEETEPGLPRATAEARAMWDRMNRLAREEGSALALLVQEAFPGHTTSGEAAPGEAAGGAAR